MAIYITEFKKDCLQRGFTKHTVETYDSNIKTFFRRMGDVDITHDVMISFLEILNKRDLATSTINGYFAALSTYCDYLEFLGEITRNPVPIFRKRYLRFKRRYNGVNARQLISIEDMAALVRIPLKIKRTEIKKHLITVGVRDSALMLLFAKTGLRKSEMRSLTLSDINLSKGELTVKKYFAKRSNCLGFFDQETIEAMTAYLEWRNDRAQYGNNDLWISHTGYKLNKDDYGAITTFYAKLIGIHDPQGELRDKFTLHCYRHFYTSWLRRAGCSRSHYRWLRGDSIDKSDDLYDHIDPMDARREYLACIPQIT